MPAFRTTLLLARQTATGIEVPPEALDELGAGKRPAVVVTVTGPSGAPYVYRTTVGSMDGKAMIPVSSDHRAASGLAAGDEVEVSLAVDDQPRELAVPAELQALLDQDAAARASFAALSHSKKRTLVDPIEQAKTPETRERRIAKAMEALRT